MERDKSHLAQEALQSLTNPTARSKDQSRNMQCFDQSYLLGKLTERLERQKYNVSFTMPRRRPPLTQNVSPVPSHRRDSDDEFSPGLSRLVKDKMKRTRKTKSILTGLRPKEFSNDRMGALLDRTITHEETKLVELKQNLAAHKQLAFQIERQYKQMSAQGKWDAFNRGSDLSHMSSLPFRPGSDIIHRLPSLNQLDRRRQLSGPQQLITKAKANDDYLMAAKNTHSSRLINVFQVDHNSAGSTKRSRRKSQDSAGSNKEQQDQDHTEGSDKLIKILNNNETQQEPTNMSERSHKHQHSLVLTHPTQHEITHEDNLLDKLTPRTRLGVVQPKRMSEPLTAQAIEAVQVTISESARDEEQMILSTSQAAHLRRISIVSKAYRNQPMISSKKGQKRNQRPGSRNLKRSLASTAQPGSPNLEQLRNIHKIDNSHYVLPQETDEYQVIAGGSIDKDKYASKLSLLKTPKRPKNVLFSGKAALAFSGASAEKLTHTSAQMTKQSKEGQNSTGGTYQQSQTVYREKSNELTVSSSDAYALRSSFTSQLPSLKNRQKGLAEQNQMNGSLERISVNQTATNQLVLKVPPVQMKKHEPELQKARKNLLRHQSSLESDKVNKSRQPAIAKKSSVDSGGEPGAIYRRQSRSSLTSLPLNQQAGYVPPTSKPRKFQSSTFKLKRTFQPVLVALDSLKELASPREEEQNERAGVRLPKLENSRGPNSNSAQFISLPYGAVGNNKGATHNPSASVDQVHLANRAMESQSPVASRVAQQHHQDSDSVNKTDSEILEEDGLGQEQVEATRGIIELLDQQISMTHESEARQEDMVIFHDSKQMSVNLPEQPSQSRSTKLRAHTTLQKTESNKSLESHQKKGKRTSVMNTALQRDEVISNVYNQPLPMKSNKAHFMRSASSKKLVKGSQNRSGSKHQVNQKEHSSGKQSSDAKRSRQAVGTPDFIENKGGQSFNKTPEKQKMRNKSPTSRLNVNPHVYTSAKALIQVSPIPHRRETLRQVSQPGAKDNVKEEKQMDEKARITIKREQIKIPAQPESRTVARRKQTALQSSKADSQSDAMRKTIEKFIAGESIKDYRSPNNETNPPPTKVSKFKRQYLASTKSGPSPSPVPQQSKLRQAQAETRLQPSTKQNVQNKSPLRREKNTSFLSKTPAPGKTQPRMTEARSPVPQAAPRKPTKQRNLPQKAELSATRQPQQQLNQKSAASSAAASSSKDFQLCNLTSLCILGKGAFGEVTLVQDSCSGLYFALKRIAKDCIRGEKHIQHVLNERDIGRSLTKSSSRNQNSFFVELVGSLQDELNLYLLFEYLPGGELLQQIKQRLSLTLAASVFYLAEILVAIKQLHECKVIYRDLKPDNILLDKQGHVKLIDFGFAKQLLGVKGERARTNCGTPAYAAPEVLIGAGYSYKADLWSFGVLICEILGGFTPFGSKALQIEAAQHEEDYDIGPGWTSMPPHQIVERANSGRITLPKNLTAVTRDLVKRILVADPEVRLGVNQIMKHKFFAGVDWAQVESKQLAPPYVPSDDKERLLSQPHLQQAMVGGNQQQAKLNMNVTAPTTENNSISDVAMTEMTSGGDQSLLRPPQGRKFKLGSNISVKSSPSTKRTNPNKILGDFHLTKINQVFHDF